MIDPLINRILVMDPFSQHRKKRVQDDNTELKFPASKPHRSPPRKWEKNDESILLLHARKILCLSMCMLFFLTRSNSSKIIHLRLKGKSETLFLFVNIKLDMIYGIYKKYICYLIRRKM